VDASAGFSSNLFNNSHGVVGVRSEYFDIGQDVGAGDFLNQRGSILAGFAYFQVETFDRSSFPSRGVRFHMQFQGMPPGIGDRHFGLMSLDWQIRRPLTGRLTLASRLIAGNIRGRDIPLHYRFYLGGTTLFRNLADRQFPVYGFAPYERSGNSAYVVGLGMQYQVARSVFVKLDWNVIRVEEAWDWKIRGRRFREGYGISTGWLSPIGPVELTFSGKRVEGPYTTNLNIGHVF
jgi:NTE family protein